MIGKHSKILLNDSLNVSISYALETFTFVLCLRQTLGTDLMYTRHDYLVPTLELYSLLNSTRTDFT